MICFLSLEPNNIGIYFETNESCEVVIEIGDLFNDSIPDLSIELAAEYSRQFKDISKKLDEYIEEEKKDMQTYKNITNDS